MQRSILILIVALTVTFAITPLPLLANDGFGPLGIGGIIVGKTDSIAMAKEVLEVSCNLITVDYDFLNESNKDVTSLIVFPLPAYPASPNESGVIASGEPSGFEVVVNGIPVNYKTKVRATLNGNDVTSKLSSIGFTQKQIASFPFDKTLLDDHELVVPKDQINKLRDAGLLLKDDDAPAWDTHVTYEWTQTFPAKKILHVTHSYHPFIAEGTASGYGANNDSTKNFCLNNKQKDKLNTLLKNTDNLDGYGEIPGTIVDYILTTANTWKDGVRDFILRVHLESEDEIISSCYPKGLSKVSPLVEQVEIKNFKPEKDLEIYFGNTRQCTPHGYGSAPGFQQ